MKLDKWGYEVRTCSDACVSAINSYYEQVLSYGRNRSVILEAPKCDPECVLGNILAAHFLCSSDSSHAAQLLDTAKSHLERASSYEKSVFEALVYLTSPDRDDDLAVEMHSKLLQDFPRDLLSLKRAQVLCFYMGQPDPSLKLVEQVLPTNEQESYIYGMLAFPLLELGRMEDAEKAGKKGYEINKDDPWSQHALCHVYQYECRFKEAVQFMSNCARSWGCLSSFMYTHNWWHVALCYLEGHAPIEKVQEIYDECIWKELERSDCVPAEVYLNAIGLLLRVYIRGEGEIFKGRLQDLAKCLTDQDFWFTEWHLDILIVWALACTGEINKAEELLVGLKFSRVSKMSEKKKKLMERGLSLSEALYKYGNGENKDALELLGHDFDAINYKVIGASDEQLDVFTELHIILLLKTGEAVKAIQAIKKQLKKREGAPFLWRLLEKAYTALGKEEAASCGQKAGELEAAYFN
ncbi:Tetratricopeptide repeat (TPR)-like superfamily protein [Striga hermonthica]|uniref:Tetratricopeptide repeat protein 38 n=1 Tax=Striga hermonthica TaxID=68872 RepID=A0A9N7RKY8_STRHE|nr:Tetratricopeptide repeat (TPR)-like superfamily protein [Striga hermonthica]